MNKDFTFSLPISLVESSLSLIGSTLNFGNNRTYTIDSLDRLIEVLLIEINFQVEHKKPLF